MARKQLEIAGTERPSNKTVDAAAENYVEQRDKRMKMSEKEKAAKTALINSMKEAGLTVYRDMSADPPLTVMLEVKDGVKVTEGEPAQAEEADS